jgi:hypothetical protein
VGRETESEQIELEKGETKNKDREAKTERREASSEHGGWGDRQRASK